MPQVFDSNFVRNAWALGEVWRQRRKDEKIRNAMSGWFNDPQTTMQRMMEIDPDKAFVLQNNIVTAQKEAAEMAKAKREEQMSTLKSVVGLLDGIQEEGGDFGTAYDRMTPILKNTLGLDDSQVAWYKGALTQNPGLLKALKKSLDPEKPMVLGPGSELVSQEGDVLHSTPFAPRDMKTVSIRRADGGYDAYVFNPATGTFEAPEQAEGTAGGGGTPLTVRTNNPGAIKDGRFARSMPGYAGSENGFARFASPEQGAAAQQQLLKSYMGRGINTVRSIVERWSPRGAENSDASVNNYVSHVAGKLGVNPDDALSPAVVPQLMAAMASFESGSDTPSRGGGIRPAISTPGKVDPRARQLSPQEVAQRSLDPSYQWQEMPNGETKIIGPAHKAATGAGKGKSPSPQQFDSTIESVDRMLATVDQLYNHQGLSHITGGVMGRLPDISGPATNAEAIREKLEKQIGMAALRDLKAASTTGASGLGTNTSNRDMQILEQSLGSLSRLQTYDQFRAELARAKAAGQRMRQRLQQARAAAAGNGGGGGAGGGNGGAPSNIPQGAIDMLKSNPSGQMRQFFDQKYGPGAAKRILGTASITTDMPLGVKTPYGTRI